MAAKLLADQGHEVIGIFLHFWSEKNIAKNRQVKNQPASFQENKCCSNDAWLSAERTAQKIGIPIYSLNFVKAFKKEVVDNFLSEYASGRTPNPCVRCNKFVKLGLLIKQANKLGYDYVASGHYVKLRKNKYYHLYKSADKHKDQSYFLYALDQSELSHLIFPLSNYRKSQVRALAKKYNLPCAERKDSQEICFVPEKSHYGFLQRQLSLKSGEIRLLAGGREPSSEKSPIIGRHQGLPLYTVGQRRGLKIGGAGPYYVAQMDYKRNILYLVGPNQARKIYRPSLIAKNINWLSGRAPKLPMSCRAAIRYNQKAEACQIARAKNNFYKVIFSKDQRAIASGQSIVFYRKNEVLGGGIIESGLRRLNTNS